MMSKKKAVLSSWGRSAAMVAMRSAFRPGSPAPRVKQNTFLVGGFNEQKRVSGFYKLNYLITVSDYLKRFIKLNI